jgi:hypothetical protein
MEDKKKEQVGKVDTTEASEPATRKQKDENGKVTHHPRGSNKKGPLKKFNI